MNDQTNQPAHGEIHPQSRSKRRRRRLTLAAALALIIGSASLATAVFAKIAGNTIDPVARMNPHGTRIRLRGPIVATAGDLVQQRVTVTQRSTGAIAQGFVHFRGTGASQQWEVIAHGLGDAKFVPGPATAVGVARTVANGDSTDAHQWLVPITLEAN